MKCTTCLLYTSLCSKVPISNMTVLVFSITTNWWLLISAINIIVIPFHFYFYNTIFRFFIFVKHFCYNQIKETIYTVHPIWTTFGWQCGDDICDNVFRRCVWDRLRKRKGLFMFPVCNSSVLRGKPFLRLLKCFVTLLLTTTKIDG